MEFGTVLIAIGVLGVIVACISYIGSGGVYKGLGRTGLSLDEPDMRPDPMVGSAAFRAEADEEIRQMLEAKSARQQARGGPALDIDEEIAKLNAPPGVDDPALAAEVRELVVARNERRMRRGEEPLDVDAEVARELGRLTG